jgi:hypothetical protein
MSAGDRRLITIASQARFTTKPASFALGREKNQRSASALDAIEARHSNGSPCLRMATGLKVHRRDPSSQSQAAARLPQQAMNDTRRVNLLPLRTHAAGRRWIPSRPNSITAQSLPILSLTVQSLRMLRSMFL